MSLFRRHSPHSAHLLGTKLPDDPRAVALVVHGGRSMSNKEARAWQGAVLRLRWLAAGLARRTDGIAVYRLQLAIRGWNGSGAAALRDLRWALDELASEHPGAPIVLVGHSMGARASARASGHPAVRGLVALAPWLPPDEPLQQLADVPVQVLHGTRDRIVTAASTRPLLVRAHRAGIDIEHTLLEGTGHAMLRRSADWHRLTAEAVTDFANRARTREATWRSANERTHAP